MDLMAKEEATPDITLLHVRVLTDSLLALMMMSWKMLRTATIPKRR